MLPTVLFKPLIISELFRKIFKLLKIRLIPNKFNKPIFAINTLFTLIKF